MVRLLLFPVVEDGIDGELSCHVTVVRTFDAKLQFLGICSQLVAYIK